MKIIGNTGKYLSKCCDNHKHVSFLKPLTSLLLVGKNKQKSTQEIKDGKVLTVCLIYSNLKQKFRGKVSINKGPRKTIMSPCS